MVLVHHENITPPLMCHHLMQELPQQAVGQSQVCISKHLSKAGTHKKARQDSQLSFKAVWVQNH